jgi:Lsr2
MVHLVDDLDGSEAGETMSFSLDTKDYVIDLPDPNAAKLRDALAPFVAALVAAAVGASLRSARR